MTERIWEHFRKLASELTGEQRDNVKRLRAVGRCAAAVLRAVEP